PAARPRTTADSPWSCRCPRFPGRGHRRSGRCSKPETGDRAAFVATDISAHTRSGGQREIVALPPQQTAERAAHQRTPDRTAERSADQLAARAQAAADRVVCDGARNVARNDLAGREPAALDVGAEDRADDRTDLSENSAAAAIRATRRRRRSGHALLQHLVGGLGIDSGIVLALDRALVHDRLALLRRDRP